MGSSFSSIKVSGNGAGGFNLLRRNRQLSWHQMPIWVCLSYWRGILATLTILGMLLAFHEVVQGAVRQGDLRRQADAIHAEATWRCRALRGLGASDNCLQRLQALAPGAATPPAQVTTASVMID